MSYEENGSIIISGLAYNMNDQDIVSYKYLFKSHVLYGKINFYAQPVLKNGQIQSPILIKTIYKDDEGIK